MTKILKVIKPFFVMESGDTFEYNADTEQYESVITKSTIAQMKTILRLFLLTILFIESQRNMPRCFSIMDMLRKLMRKRDS